MSNNIDDHVWCDDERTLKEATDAINLCSEVVMDCEGENLGSAGGSLSLITFHTIGREISKTYLIDVPNLTNDALCPVFDIIQSPSPTKIMFDGRMDYAELFHGRGIPIRGVLDLQLADIYSRRQRGEDEDDQLHRLSPYLSRGEVGGQRNCYTQVQKLNSLQQCLREHNVGSGIQDGYTPVSHILWLQRPLPDAYMRYAMRDVYFIGLLYNHFKDEGYIASPLSAQSDHYVAIWRDAKPKKTDGYRHHALLPLQIIDHTSYGPFLACICCQRNLPRAAYSKSAWGGSGQRRCWVCRAIYLKLQIEKARDGYDSDDYGVALFCGYDSDDYGGFGGYGSGNYRGYESDDYGGYSS